MGARFRVPEWLSNAVVAESLIDYERLQRPWQSGHWAAFVNSTQSIERAASRPGLRHIEVNGCDKPLASRPCQVTRDVKERLEYVVRNIAP